jgi:5-methylcytosine-specific restriction endonuclease McrA
MTWTISNDSAWIKVDAQSYRHYSGVRVRKIGRLWTAYTVRGDSIPGHPTALDAVIALQRRGFWCFDGFGQLGILKYGHVHHRCSPVGRDKDRLFVFFSSIEEWFPKSLKSALSRHFSGKAVCVSCLLPMAEIQTCTLQQFDGPLEEKKLYLVCDCGYPVWQMESSLYSVARDALDKYAGPWRRKQMLKTAGGKHSLAEIRKILALQDGCCIYCNANFTDERRPTKDHLLPLTEGGSDWALNLVLACRSCNSSRGNIPFRTFCTLSSPAQNERILLHLKRRLVAVGVEHIPKEALDCFEKGLAKHDPKHPRFCAIKGGATARLNVKANKLLPRNVAAILTSNYR